MSWSAFGSAFGGAGGFFTSSTTNGGWYNPEAARAQARAHQAAQQAFRAQAFRSAFGPDAEEERESALVALEDRIYGRQIAGLRRLVGLRLKVTDVQFELSPPGESQLVDC